MTRFLLLSHDGYGLGHVRRNSLIADRLVAADPTAEVTLVTGAAAPLPWTPRRGVGVVHVPPVIKDATHRYAAASGSTGEALLHRSARIVRIVQELQPDVVLVDRHPFGIDGELRPGLALARDLGAAVVLGLRDILDEPVRVAAELAGPGWDGVDDVYDRVLVYGQQWFCDHEAEYGVPLPVEYCGWVTEQVPSAIVDEDLVVIAAGGGGDGEALARLGVAALDGMRTKRGLLVAGPYGAAMAQAARRSGSRVDVVAQVPSCAALFARAGATVQMAGCNSALEALGAGVRPVLIPRRVPRREQTIRAGRLAALGLADVLDEDAHPAELRWLLSMPRRMAPGIVERAGIHLDGAERAALALGAMVQEAVAA